MFDSICIRIENKFTYHIQSFKKYTKIDSTPFPVQGSIPKQSLTYDAGLNNCRPLITFQVAICITIGIELGTRRCVFSLMYDLWTLNTFCFFAIFCFLQNFMVITNIWVIFFMFTICSYRELKYVFFFITYIICTNIIASGIQCFVFIYVILY